MFDKVLITPQRFLLPVQKEQPEVFYKKAVLKPCAIFERKHLYWSLFLIKSQAYN